MNDILIALSTWLHAIATIVMVGFFVFTSLVYLPVLERELKPGALRALLEKFSARLRPFFGGSLLIFLVTGTYLMLVNESYMGLGDFFANTWSVLIIVKHVLIVPFLGLAFYSERGPLAKVSDANPAALDQYRLVLNLDLLLGLVILLLTALAQAG
jgi:uncharacterized membrane protein